MVTAIILIGALGLLDALLIYACVVMERERKK